MKGFPVWFNFDYECKNICVNESITSNKYSFVHFRGLEGNLWQIIPISSQTDRKQFVVLNSLVNNIKFLGCDLIVTFPAVLKKKITVIPC